MAIPDRGEIGSTASSAGEWGCLLCGGETAIRFRLPHIWDQPDDSRTFDIRWCEACDFGFLHPRPTALDLERFYDQAGAPRDQAERNRTLLEKVRLHLAWRIGHADARQIDAALIDSTVGKPCASICVFGCTGLDLVVGLKRLGHRVVGVERNADAVHRARDGGFEVFSGSADAPPREVFEASFDAVVLNNVLPGCREPRVALQNAHRILEPAGHLFAEVPNHESYSARRSGPAWCLFDAGRNLNFFTGKSLTRFVESTGFHVKDMLYRQAVPQFSRSRMIVEQEIWDRLYAKSNRGDSRAPSRNSTVELWTRLARLRFQRPSERFEIVAVIGTRLA